MEIHEKAKENSGEIKFLFQFMKKIQTIKIFLCKKRKNNGFIWRKK